MACELLVAQRPYYQDSSVQLYHGTWQQVFDRVPKLRADHLITDPPYSAITHRHFTGSASGDWRTPRGLDYGHLETGEIPVMLEAFASRVDGWLGCMCDAPLINAYTEGYLALKRVQFAPVACVLRGMNVRRSGDGPSNWTVYLMMSRSKALYRWGVRPGAYVGSPRDKGMGRGRRIVVGMKPLWLMQAIIGDYTKPDQVVLDPFAGGCTTGIAARSMGRRAILIEAREEVCAAAALRLEATANLPAPELAAAGGSK